MIQANELRIGNLVYDQFMEISKVAAIIEDEIGVYPDIEMLPIDVFSPVKITPEILEKCKNWENRGSEWRPKLGTSIPSFGITLMDDEWRVTIYGKWFGKKGQMYVHQFQNLVFALTGTELQITLP